MANVILDDTHLTNIANAIREKNGETTTYTPGDMAKAITDLPSGGVDDNAFIFHANNCNYLFAYSGLKNLYNTYGDKFSVKFYNAKYMFMNNDYITTLNFPISTIGVSEGGNVDFMFQHSKIEHINEGCLINKNHFLYTFSNMFNEANYLKELPSDMAEFFVILASRIDSCNYSSLFYKCHSLRSVSGDVLALIMRGNDGAKTAGYQGFYYCYCLDELVGVAPPAITKSQTSAFYKMVEQCSRLKEFQFIPNRTYAGYNGTLDLSTYVGYGSSIYRFTSFGFTADTQISDDATYQALKDNPDSWTIDINYSRYNHTSAVNTINSLPNCSAYGTNTIKFKGASGALTDGGAINTLTEEEIAVAAAKGWTVTLV